MWAYAPAGFAESTPHGGHVVGKWDCSNPQRPRFVHGPGSGHRIRVGQPDIDAPVIGEVQVVAAEGILDPVRHTDERRPGDVAAHPPVHVRGDDGAVEQALDSGSSAPWASGPTGGWGGGGWDCASTAPGSARASATAASGRPTQANRVGRSLIMSSPPIAACPSSPW